MQCEHCHADFTDRKHPDRRFCSLRCSGLAGARTRGQEESREQQCAQCGAGFWSMPSAGKRFCSKPCADLGSVKPRPKCECCGEPVRLMRNRYCSKSCRGKAQPRPGITSVSGFYLRAQRANPDPAPCAICGGPGKHRHHHDYSKPEDVTWLCITCHRREHAGERGRTIGAARKIKAFLV